MKMGDVYGAWLSPAVMVAVVVIVEGCVGSRLIGFACLYGLPCVSIEKERLKGLAANGAVCKGAEQQYIMYNHNPTVAHTEF